MAKRDPVDKKIEREFRSLTQPKATARKGKGRKAKATAAVRELPARIARSAQRLARRVNRGR